MIEIVPYQQSWPQQFHQIAGKLRDATRTWDVGTYHIGSTAIPGLAAKNVIDIQVSVNAFEPQMEEEFVRIGFNRMHYLTDHQPPGRDDLNGEQLYKWFFHLRDPAVNLHVRKRGMFNERYPLLCRDYLRSHPYAAKAYEAIKIGLAKHFPDDLAAYYEIKDPVFDVLTAGAEIWARTVNWSPAKTDI